MVTAEHLEVWLGRRGWKASTRRSALASIRGFFRWAHRSGRRQDDPAAELLPVRADLGKPRPCPESYVLRAVMAAGPRERLMLSLGASAGLRRAEIARVRADDVEVLGGRHELRVRGKGDRTRLIPISDEFAERLLARGPGWCFPSPAARGPGHLTAAHVGKLISRTLPAGWTTHTLRHRFASQAYAVDRDIRAVQELLGHASVVTTQIYTAIPDNARRRAAAGADLPLVA
ncbi:tyrosine-type recombinase/integrase [Skermania piniformis]|nr:tyrosine-type recombinase/integrase [Skermania piniformis]